MPVIETYRGVGIHDFQDEDRIAQVVKPAIDQVFAISDAEYLFDYAKDYLNPPEARLFAGDKYRAMREIQADAHDKRLGGLERLAAVLAGLGAVRWADPDCFGTLLQPVAPGAPRPAPRPPHQRARLLAAKGR